MTLTVRVEENPVTVMRCIAEKHTGCTLIPRKVP